MAHELHLVNVRKKLTPRREPYWGMPIERGLYVGLRKLDSGSGNWIARWRDELGAQHYHAIGPIEGMGYDEAKKAARDWQRARDAGVDAKGVKTVADACREYVEDRRRVKGSATADDAAGRFERTIYHHPLGKLPLSKVGKKRIEDWRHELIAPRPLGKPLSKAGANRTLIALRAALNYAVSNRYVTSDRAIEWKQVKPYEAGKRRDLFLDVTQRRALLAEASGGLRDLLEAAMLTGCRAGELTNALRSQFDHRTQSMTFVGKTGSRTVPLAPAAAALFQRLAQSKLPTAHLLTRDDGKRWAHSDWDELVRDAAKRAKLPTGVCLYTLRHSFITEAISGGLSPLEVARLVGTSLAMIDKHYGHLAQNAARERLGMVSFV